MSTLKRTISIGAVQRGGRLSYTLIVRNPSDTRGASHTCETFEQVLGRVVGELRDGFARGEVTLPPARPLT